MIPAPAIIFVESNTSGTGRLFARAAVRLGFSPILFASEPGRYGYAVEDNVPVRRLDTSDPTALEREARSIANEGGLAGVTTSSDYFVSQAARLARTLGLKGPDPEALDRCRNKEEQRRAYATHGVGSPSSVGVSTEEEAEAAALKQGLPVIVKPVMGSGSVGVKLCASVEEVRAHASVLLKVRTNERGMPIPQRVLIEQVAQGPEFSVETFDDQVVGVTQKHLGVPPFFVEVGHDFPAELPSAQAEALGAEAVKALKALGLGWGPAHTELRWTASGPCIIEVNPRLAGGFIPELVRLALGVDLVERTVARAAGLPTTPPAGERAHASLRFLLPPGTGVLAQATGLDEARSVPGVHEARLYVQEGAAVSLRGDFRDRIGHVIARAPTPQGARTAAEAAWAQVRISLKSEPVSSP